jgi:Fe-Mn family superoxide dismutase
MELNHYPFTLPPLPYAYAALEPHIDAETMHYHHDKHFATYISNLNAALKPYPALQTLTLEQLLTERLPVPADVNRTILRNAGGVYNHNFFFNHLSPNGCYLDKELLESITRQWGSVDKFKSELTAAALSVFGSGWGVFARRGDGALKILTLANQDTALADADGFTETLLLMDVWEHAYYLKYKNDRADYVTNLWNVVTFAAV